MDEHPGSESPVRSGDASSAAMLDPNTETKAGSDMGPLILTDRGKAATPAAVAASIEAILLSLDKPVPGPRLAEALGLMSEEEADVATEADAAAATEATGARESGRKRSAKSRGGKGSGPGGVATVRAAIDLLNEQYEQTGRSFRVERVAGGFRLMTLPRFAQVIEEFHGRRERHALSRAGLETLAIIAYKQPVTRAGLEAIRGVACGEVLRSLIERRLITIVGRAEELGRPMLYGTTKAFLETFGLATIKDLPTAEELKSRSGEED